MQQYTETFANSLGRPIVGGSVAVYTYPGNVLAVLYSDNGVTPKTNPVTTDANGLFEFYAADGRYSLYLTSDSTTPLTLTDAVLLEDPADANPITASALTVNGVTTMLANSASPALKVTQTGAGPVLLLEDSTSPDNTPVVIDQNGRAVIGHTAVINTGVGISPGIGVHGTATQGNNIAGFMWSADGIPPYIGLSKSRGATPGTQGVVSSGDGVGGLLFTASDGIALITAARIDAVVDGTPGTNDMPGRIVFSTTPDGSATPVERMRIDNAGGIGIGATAAPGTNVRVARSITGNAFSNGVVLNGQVQSDAVSRVDYYLCDVSTAAGAYAAVNHYRAQQSSFTGAVTNQKGFEASSSLIGATNNYGFYADIPAAANRWNFYANGTAANFFAGDMQFSKTVTAAGTTGARTINQTMGSVNFAAAAATLVVTNSLVTANSVILCTCGTADATMKSATAVAGAGSFTITANAVPTAETRVNFVVFN